VFALNRILSGYVGGLPGIHAMWAGADLTWHHPLTVGTEIRTTAFLKDLVEHETRFAGRAFQQIYHVEITGSDGTALCSGDSWCFRTERDTARERGTKYDESRARPPMRYTPDDLRQIFDLYEAEEIRGPKPRYVEDVQVGDELPPMVKGADDRHRLHRLRPGLGRPLHPGQQAGPPAAQEAPQPGDRQRLRHPRRPGAGALGSGAGHRRRHPGRL